MPTKSPTKEPTVEPTKLPTEGPTLEPTKSPTKEPTLEPTNSPTKEPTPEPTLEPTKDPSRNPTVSPSENPSKSPTLSPTEQPTMFPTSAPTETPLGLLRFDYKVLLFNSRNVNAKQLMNNNRNMKDRIECAVRVVTEDAIDSFSGRRKLDGMMRKRRGSVRSSRRLARIDDDWEPRVYDAFDQGEDCESGKSCVVVSFKTFVFTEGSEDAGKLKEQIDISLKKDLNDGTFQGITEGNKCKGARRF